MFYVSRFFGLNLSLYYIRKKKLFLCFLVKKILNIVDEMEINGLNITIVLQIKKMQKMLAITEFM